MTPTKLAKRVLELDELGTDGPWEWVGHDLQNNKYQDVIEFSCETSFGLTGANEEMTANDDDLSLIAEYRTAAPQLARLVMKYREALEFYAKRLDKGMSIPDEEDFPEYGNLARAALDWSPEDE